MCAYHLWYFKVHHSLGGGRYWSEGSTHLKVFRRRRPEERWIIFIFAGRRENERLGLDGRRRVGQAGRQFPPSSDTTIFSPAHARRPPTQQPASTILHARAQPPCHTFGRGEANCKGNARVPAKGDRSVQCRSFYRLLACSQTSVLYRGLRVWRDDILINEPSRISKPRQGKGLHKSKLQLSWWRIPMK